MTLQADMTSQIFPLTATSSCQHPLCLHASNLHGIAVATTTTHVGVTAHISMLATTACQGQSLALLYANARLFTRRQAMMNDVGWLQTIITFQIYRDTVDVDQHHQHIHEFCVCVVHSVHPSSNMTYKLVKTNRPTVKNEHVFFSLFILCCPA